MIRFSEGKYLTHARARVFLQAAAYQHVDSAAHPVFWTLVVGDGPVGQQVLQQAAEQQSELLPRL